MKDTKKVINVNANHITTKSRNSSFQKEKKTTIRKITGTIGQLYIKPSKSKIKYEGLQETACFKVQTTKET